jgi:hypothetical protein
MDWVRGRAREVKAEPPSSWSESAQCWSAPTVRFLGEQDGGPEQVLKQSLRSLLVSRPAVARGYLARVNYGDPAAHEVALCIGGPTDEVLVKEVASAFANQFGRAAHLDVMFLSPAQEIELRQVCRPFYEAG